MSETGRDPELVAPSQMLCALLDQPRREAKVDRLLNDLSKGRRQVDIVLYGFDSGVRRVADIVAYMSERETSLYKTQSFMFGFITATMVAEALGVKLALEDITPEELASWPDREDDEALYSIVQDRTAAYERDTEAYTHIITERAVEVAVGYSYDGPTAKIGWLTCLATVDAYLQEQIQNEASAMAAEALKFDSGDWDAELKLLLQNATQEDP